MTAAKYFDVLVEETRILVVDDDPIMREFASVYLSSPAAVVETVESGKDALLALAKGRFDVVLLDIDMPGLSGFDVLERLRMDAHVAHPPVIVITGREDIVSIDRAYQLCATSFVSKPVNWRLLSYQIRFVIRADLASRNQATADDAPKVSR